MAYVQKPHRNAHVYSRDIGLKFGPSPHLHSHLVCAGIEGCFQVKCAGSNDLFNQIVQAVMNHSIISALMKAFVQDLLVFQYAVTLQIFGLGKLCLL